MLTSHCSHCGTPKEQSEWALEFCGGCQTIRSETRAAVSLENTSRETHNAKVLTPEKRQEIADAARADYTGERAQQMLKELGVQPLIDMSTALKEALAQRAHHTNSGHTDPRAVFNPGLGDSRAGNLGMNARIPPGAFVREA